MNIRLKEIEERKKEIRTLLEQDGDDLNLEELEQEIRSLDEEKEKLEKRAQIASGIQAGTIPANTIPKPQGEKRTFEGMERDEILSTPEYRSAYLKRLQGKLLNGVEERALTTDAGAAAAVPTETLNMIIDKLRQTSALFPRINVSYVPGNLSLVVANAKNAAEWKAEGTDGTPADDTVVEINLTGYELIKLVEISAAAQAMTIDAFEAYIAKELGRQMAIAIENAILNGTGSGQPTGILTGITWDSSNSTTWTAGSNVDYDTLMNSLALLPTMYHPNAVFIMNRSMLFGGIRKIKTTDGQPIFTYNPQDPARNAVLGYPVIVDDYMPDSKILLGDLNYYYWNFSQAPQIETSREAAFRSGKVVYRGLAVADGKPALSEAFVKIEEAAA
ncbi:phage major capsid protein [Melghirimyces algeriensis]|uniref:Phage major capsid protein, HK97 family n=1 Tax=Melghirimyces algeriensis TaxID=910412 RepID=A0A521C642_9BACL|nr:phage major capsid protein [Melghirimyces algeriensis]SMO54977.1 phage major capsid protein, HK97 family [Melghirimyces algeriensis]